ncbi:hypothetical protein [Pseudoalteromonas byunsanensis]|uniref:DUF1579 domain-containing protein n=1 Tax=Pseudoalteromonas byunsanensis TaxID=327939 RepID=A0A1S1NBW5_9GAMM|nr:hypothetical protein [Pseudoalteromonas byunsanensis]OHU96917.1 hypothetical protein BIW53_03420 [Pseudoalteromonas byunsanensis]
MKIFKFLIFLFLFIQSYGVLAAKQLVSELRIFEPYLGTWQADFAVAGGKPSMQDVSHWEIALNGTAVRTLHSINEGMYGGESLILWDQSKQKVVFFYFTTAGFYTQGTMDVLDDGSFVAYEDVAGNQDGITQVKSTSRFVDGQMEVSTQYLKYGTWTEPEKRHYTRSSKAVKFH